MNLLDDQWIPVRTRSGATRMIAPFELTSDDPADPLVDVAPPRSDLASGLLLFLCGLLETTMSPADDRDWRKLYKSPPSSEELRAAFEPIKYAFFLDEGDQRFMQDPAARDGKSKSVRDLLLGYKNAHFFKPGAEGLCSSCAAASLITYQHSGYYAGRAYFEGVRGAGAVSTILWSPKSLWHVCWANTRPVHHGKPCFPWTDGLFGTAAARPVTISSPDVGAHYLHWSCHASVWLDVGTNVQEKCVLCKSSAVFCSAHFVHNGPKHAGSWDFPFTPKVLVKLGKPDEHYRTIRATSPHLGFDTWYSLVGRHEDRVSEVAAILRDPPRQVADMGVRIFGHVLSNATVDAYLDCNAPLMPRERRDATQPVLADLVDATRFAHSILRSSVCAAFFDRGPDSFWKTTEARRADELWARLEARFFEIALKRPLTLFEGDSLLALRMEWHQHTVDECTKLFDEIVDVDRWVERDPEQVFRTRASLRRTLYGSKYRKALGLPKKSPKSEVKQNPQQRPADERTSE